ncbi:hypothetical protein AVEN_12723-1 [Araneus ventricosus]|uniref:Uncharacterized protein n=1 Tax=Araneus ventricosus TaxID=182803 RepID=A0A4Y2ABD5_ARAVE|nr:hypothetical protein AVEN_12723-1 [Araneus ventricosus]
MMTAGVVRKFGEGMPNRCRPHGVIYYSLPSLALSLSPDCGEKRCSVSTTHKERGTITVNRLTSSCLGIRGQLKKSLHDSSNPEVGVLIAVIGHGPTPPEGGTFRHRSGVTQNISLLFQTGKQEPAYL